MNLTVHQSIIIHQLRINTISQSSILQIGAAGKVSCLSNQYNYQGYVPGAGEKAAIPLVPLPAIT